MGLTIWLPKGIPHIQLLHSFLFQNPLDKVWSANTLSDNFLSLIKKILGREKCVSDQSFYFTLLLKVNKRRREIPELSMKTSCHENPLAQGQNCLLAFTPKLDFLFNCTFFSALWIFFGSVIRISEMIDAMIWKN